MSANLQPIAGEAINDDLFGEAPSFRRRRLQCLPSTGFMRAARRPIVTMPPPKDGPRRVRSVDSFAGGGGASNGCEAALRALLAADLLPVGHGTTIDFAVNHDDAAIAMHKANHPDTLHLPHNVWQVSLRALLGDDLFGLLWLSPDCRDHSSAKGGPITSKAVRDLATVLFRWLKELPEWQQPWTICLENVGAFSKWGPLIPRRDGQPGFERDPERIGETFHWFVKTLAGFGYSVGWTELVACDYGDPTIRKRLYLCARRDGKRIRWPKPTHGDPKSDAVKVGELKPWPVAADIIDFSRPCPSILMTKEEARAFTKATGIRIIRPMAFKTDARIAKGVKRYVLDAAEPFIVVCNHGGNGFRGQPVRSPMATVTRARDAHGLVVPHVASFRGDNIGRPVEAPAPTVTANSFIKRPGGAAPIGVVETAVVPHISAYYGEGQGSTDRSAGATEPLRTVPTAPRHAVVETTIAPHVMTMRNSEKPHNGADEPTHAVTSGGAGLADVEATLAPFVSRGQHGGGNRPADAPHHTIAASDGDQNQLVVPYLVPRYGERDGQEPRTLSVEKPAPVAVPDGNGGHLAAVYLAQHNTDMTGHDAREPISTIVQKGCTQGIVEATFIKREFGKSVGSPMKAPVGSITAGGGGKTLAVAAHMLSLKGTERRDGSCEDPHDAICAGGQHSALVTLPLMTAYYSTGGQHARVDEPSLTVPTKARFGLTEADAAPPPLTDEQLASARKVAAFLRKHGCWDDRELVTVVIRGETFVIVDIGMRMLTPRELARAQGFPDSYILDAPYKGGRLSETEQRHKIGNSVCEKPASAVVIENYRPPLEWGRRTFMEAAE